MVFVTVAVQSVLEWLHLEVTTNQEQKLGGLPLHRDVEGGHLLVVAPLRILPPVRLNEQEAGEGRGEQSVSVGKQISSTIVDFVSSITCSTMFSIALLCRLHISVSLCLCGLGYWLADRRKRWHDF